MMNRRGDKEASRDALPHPAEDLSADDDLLSWILVDQLGCLPNSKLGVHPQQVHFVGPPFKPDEVLKVIKETVVRGHLQPAMQQLQDFHLIKSHLAGKTKDGQRERFIIHMRRYLLPLLPTSRVEIHTTSRYTSVTGHVELAVYATRHLSPGMVLQELQGSVVPLPDEWREEMELGEDFALAAAEDELEESEDDSDNEIADTRSTDESVTATRRRREVERQRGARRSDRTKRRDFSIVWSGLKRCFQLFLGPARFLNHDCTPNVELLRQGRYVTFRVTRPIKIGDELTTFYGDNYFGKSNAECLCLSCEQAQCGGFTAKPTMTRSRSRDSSSAPSTHSPSMRNARVRPSSLRNMFRKGQDSEAENPQSRPNEPQIEDETVDVQTSDKERVLHGLNSQTIPRVGGNSDSDEDGVDFASESDSESPEPAPIRRAPSSRVAAKSIKPWAYLRRPPRQSTSSALEASDPSTPEQEDALPSDFPRCVTCTKPLHERIWFLNRYFDHCQRCTRHSLIFDLPWPAHRAQDVLEYPPSHLIPAGYIPRKISTVPLPSLTKQSKKKVEEPESLVNLPMNRNQHRACKLRTLIEREDFVVEQLREAAWAVEEAKQQAKLAHEEAKAEAKRLREEAKRKRNETRLKGSGVWSHYEYISAEELERREKAKTIVLSGTRRGGRFRDADNEGEMTRLAEERRKKEEDERSRREDLPNDPPRDRREATVRHFGDSEMNSTNEQVRIALEESAPGGPKGTSQTPEARAGGLTAEISFGSRYESSTNSSAGNAGDMSGRLSSATGDQNDREAHYARMCPSNMFGRHNRGASPSAVSAPAESGHSESSTPPKRKRGRPPGTGKHQIAAVREALAAVQAQTWNRHRGIPREYSYHDSCDSDAPSSHTQAIRKRFVVQGDRKHEAVDVTFSSSPSATPNSTQIKGKSRADDSPIVSDSKSNIPALFSRGIENPRRAPKNVARYSGGFTPISAISEAIITPMEAEARPSPFVTNGGVYALRGDTALALSTERANSCRASGSGLPSVDDASPHGSIMSSVAGEAEAEEEAVLQTIVVAVVPTLQTVRPSGEKRRRDAVEDVALTERPQKKRTFWVSRLGDPAIGLARQW